MIKKLYRWTAGIIALAVVFVCFQFDISVQAANYSPNEEINSEAALLVYLDSEEPIVIYEKNADQQFAPASLTKIMTTIIALEELADSQQTLDEIMVTAPAYIYDEFYGEDVSNADIRKDEKLSMRDLLYANMLQSACEASSIIADHISNGDIPSFVRKMNDKALEAGATNTVFTNAHGLEDPNQLTTARDMYLITKYALDNVDGFEEIATTTEYEMAATEIHPEPRSVYHTNLMLNEMRGGEKYYYPYAKGIKTGSLDSVGKNLVCLGENNGNNYLLVTLAAPIRQIDGSVISDNNSFVDAKYLFNWAFNEFEVKTVVSREETVKSVPVRLSWDKDKVLLRPEKNVSALLPRDIDLTNVQQIIDIPDAIDAPVVEGQKVGTMQIKLNDEVIGEVNLVAAETIEASAILEVGDSVKSFFGSLVFKIILGILIFIILFYIVISIVYNRKRRRKKYTKKKNKRRPR